MFAVVDVAGHQVTVSPKARIVVPKLAAKAGSSVEIGRVLLVADGRSVKIGNPTVAGVSVRATILSHVKDDKVMVFRKKRRKGYRVRRVHRQQYTEVEITTIG